MMKIQRAYVEAGGGQIHYRWLEGADETPIVFLHQTASSSAMYEKLMARLAGDRPQYAFDTPGFGQSDPPPPAPTVASYARAILAAARELGIDRFHVFGHHTGATIGCEIAASAPDRVASLTMAGPPYMDAAAREFWTNKTEAMVIQADGRHVMAAWERAQALDPRPGPGGGAAGDRRHAAGGDALARGLPGRLQLRHAGAVLRAALSCDDAKRQA